MKKLKRIFALLCLAPTLPLMAQTTRGEVLSDLDKAGGVYYAYPTRETHPTPPPKGYKPFHISHYGRHGSRYLISDADYKNARDVLRRAREAGALTPLGLDVLCRLDTVIKEADGLGGALTPLGVRQHRGIAERMVKDYPEVFKGRTPVSARSTTVVRCVLSMDAFCERLKELNPQLRTDRQSADRYMSYLNYHSPESNAYCGGDWKIRYRKFEEEHVRPDRLMASLFSDPAYVRDRVNPRDLMWGLYWVAVDMQDMETPISFYDIFEPEEVFDIWQCTNYNNYVIDGNYPGNGGLVLGNAANCLRNIIETADTALVAETPSVALRFGHDGNLMPLAGLLRLEGCHGQETEPDSIYKVFSNFKIAPMAGNVQLVFFKNPKKPGDVLVKFLLNEEETAIPVKTDLYPFYRWKDVRDFYLNDVMKDVKQ